MDPKQTAQQRYSEGKCIVCNEKRANRRRGLCVTHYTRFLTAREQVPVEDRHRFEMKLIEAGHLLPSRQGQKSSAPQPDVFADSLEEFLAERDSLLEEAERVERDVKQDRKTTKKPKRPKKP